MELEIQMRNDKNRPGLGNPEGLFKEGMKNINQKAVHDSLDYLNSNIEPTANNEQPEGNQTKNSKKDEDVSMDNAVLKKDDSASNITVLHEDYNEDEKDTLTNEANNNNRKRYAVSNPKISKSLLDIAKDLIETENNYHAKRGLDSLYASEESNRSTFLELHPSFNTNCERDIQDFINIYCLRTKDRKYEVVERLLLYGIEHLVMISEQQNKDTM